MYHTPHHPIQHPAAIAGGPGTHHRHHHQPSSFHRIRHASTYSTGTALCAIISPRPQRPYIHRRSISPFFFHLRPSPSNNGKTFSSLDEKGYVPKQRGRAAGWGLHTHPRGLQGLLLRACVIDRPLFHPIDCCAWGGTTLTFHFFACDGCEVVRL